MNARFRTETQSLFLLKPKALFLLVASLGISALVDSRVLAQEYYVDQTGDTVSGDLIEMRLGRLYFYDSEGEPKFINLEKIKGYKINQEPYSIMATMDLEEIKKSSWIIDGYPDSIYKAQIGLLAGTHLITKSSGEPFDYSENKGGYPYTYVNADKYKNAIGELSSWMPYLSVAYKSKKMKVYSVGVGYSQSSISENPGSGQSLDISLKDRYFFWQYDSPIRKGWIKTKKDSKEILYPLYGIGVSINSKNLIYKRTESYTNSQYWVSAGNYYTETAYSDYSMLMRVQARIGAYWQKSNYFVSWGLNVSLASYANGRYARSYHYHSSDPNSESDEQENGSYSRFIPLGRYNHGLFLSVGYYFD